MSAGHPNPMTAMRPTREGQQVKARRGRTIFYVTAGGLVAVIGLLYYIITSSTPPPVVKPQPRINVMPKVENTTKVETPPVKPPPPVVEMPPVELQVVSQPAGAEVYIDGNLVSKTPYKFPHKRGTLVRIEVRKRGFDPYYEELEPDADKLIDIKLEKAGRHKKGGEPKKPEGKPPTGPSPTPEKKPDPKNVGKPPEGTPAKESGLPTGLRDPFHGKK
jgi:hypothetical protein